MKENLVLIMETTSTYSTDSLEKSVEKLQGRRDALTISQLIERLQYELKTYGDMPVVIDIPANNTSFLENIRTIHNRCLH